MNKKLELKMNGKRCLKLAIPILVSAMVLISCKKDEDETREHMSGSVNFDFPQYAITGQKVETYVSGVTTPQNPEYMWVSHDIKISDTDTVYGQSISFYLPDEVGEYSITAYAMSPEYYSLSKKATVNVISSDIKDVGGMAEGDEKFVDPRDGESYYVVTYGSLKWFTQNLRYAGTDNAVLGRPYENSDGIDMVFGRLYSWNEATGGVSGSGLGNGPQGACPEGWSVPTAEDWENLAEAVGGKKVGFYESWEGLGDSMTSAITLSGTAMWPYSPENGHSNTSRWNGFPSGNSRDNFGEFENISVYGMWWASTGLENGMAPYRYVYYNSDYFDVYYTDRDSYGVSVRCVKLVD